MLVFGQVDYLLRAVDFDASGFSKTAFYPTVFVQPLYEPIDYFYFTFGGRLRAPGELLWDTAEDPPDALLAGMLSAINEQAVPFLERFRQPIDMAVACEAPPDQRFVWQTDGIHVLETAAYSWFLAGNGRKSISKLEAIQRILKAEPNNRDWVRELQERASQFLDWLRAGDEESARRQLLHWADKTTKALGLEEFRRMTAAR